MNQKSHSRNCRTKRVKMFELNGVRPAWAHQVHWTWKHCVKKSCEFNSLTTEYTEHNKISLTWHEKVMHLNWVYWTWVNNFHKEKYICRWTSGERKLSWMEVNGTEEKAILPDLFLVCLSKNTVCSEVSSFMKLIPEVCCSYRKDWLSWLTVSSHPPALPLPPSLHPFTHNSHNNSPCFVKARDS